MSILPLASRRLAAVDVVGHNSNRKFSQYLSMISSNDEFHRPQTPDAPFP